MKPADIMANMTARVCEVLDPGVIFWQQPWAEDYIGFHTLVNAETGKDYKASNFFMLNLDGYINKFPVSEIRHDDPMEQAGRTY